MKEFSLLDERWIPVRLSDGARCEVGIIEAFARAKEIASIEDSSPLVVAALHRLLLAVLYRAIDGPTDDTAAVRLFAKGVPTPSVLEYLEQWRERFWLFHPTHPFSQVADFTPSNWRAWPVLAAEHNADNAKVLFDHIDVNAADSIGPAAAARWLLATQNFAVSAGKTELGHSCTAPSATSAMVLPCGESLHDTLLFSLVPQRRSTFVEDLPLWERASTHSAAIRADAGRTAFGFADLYTWRSRSVRLERTADGRVGRVAFATGVKPLTSSGVDPMVAYRIDEKLGRLPVQFRDRGLWRDFDSLLPDGGDLVPAVITNAVLLWRSQVGGVPATIMVLGQANDKAKIRYWRMERYALPAALRGNRTIRAEVRQMLVEAEDGQRVLWRASSSFARDLMGRGDREPTAKDVKDFVRQMLTMDSYWSAMERCFHQVLRGYAVDRDPAGIASEFRGGIKQSIGHAWDSHRVSAANGDVWTIRALVRAEREMGREMVKFDEQYSHIKSEVA